MLLTIKNNVRDNAVSSTEIATCLYNAFNEPVRRYELGAACFVISANQFVGADQGFPVCLTLYGWETATNAITIPMRVAFYDGTIWQQPSLVQSYAQAQRVASGTYDFRSHCSP